MALGLHSFNDGQKLKIMRFVLNLYKNHFFRKIHYWVLLTKIGFN